MAFENGSCAKWEWARARKTIGALSLSVMSMSTAWAGCQVETPAPKSPQQLAQEEQMWGHWDAFEERQVKLDPLLAPNASYHVLMKRPGNQAHTNKPVVVFLHGFPEFARSWENWLNVIGVEHDTIAIDLKGYGESSRPTSLSAYNLYRVTFELDAVVSCLGYKQVIPVGHDWGGTFAWMYGMLMPLKTKAVVVLSTPHPYPFFRELAKPDSDQSRRSQYINLIRQNTPEATAEARRLMSAGPDDVFQPFYAGARANRLILTNMASDDLWERMFSYYRVMDLPASPTFYTDKPNWLALLMMKVRAPALAIYGANDVAFAPQSWQGVEAFVPKLDLRKLEGQGHFINHTAPELPGQVLNFINAQTAQ